MNDKIKIIVFPSKIDKNLIFSKIEDEPQYWGCGKTIHEAIGDMILYHSDKFNMFFDLKNLQEKKYDK